MNYYRRFPGDYARDTHTLTLRQHGAYNLLLDYQYAQQKPILSIRQANIICHTDRHDPEGRSNQRAVKFILAKFFILTPEGYWNNRVREEIAYVIKKSEMARNAALAGQKRDRNGTETGQKRDKVATMSGHENIPNSIVFNDSDMRTLSERSAIPDTRFQTPDKPKEREEKPNYAPTAQDEVIPISLWLSFVEMRRKIRKPLTERGGEMIRNKLRWFRDHGADPIEILEQSIMNSWAGVFPVKGSDNGHTESFEERRQRKSQEAISQVRTRIDEVVREVDVTPRLKSSEQRTDRCLHRGLN